MIVFKPAAVLPLSFLSIRANKVNSQVNVEWTVNNDVNVAYYEVERSANGTDFSTIGTVQSAKATGNMQYSLKDMLPLNGYNYYRIRSVAVDREVKYSAVVTVNNSTTNRPTIQVYPNPVKDRNISVHFSDVDKGRYTMDLYNQLGQKVLTSTVNYNGGSLTHTLQVPQSVAKGVYHMDVKGPVPQSMKIVVQ